MKLASVAVVLVVAIASAVYWWQRPPIVQTRQGPFEWRQYEGFDGHYALVKRDGEMEIGASLTWGKDPDEIYRRLLKVARFKSFTPLPSTADEWRENGFLLTGVYAKNWHGMATVRRAKTYTIQNLTVDERLPPRRLIAIRLESPSPKVGGHKLFDEWDYSWVDLDTDLTVYNPTPHDEVVATFERPLIEKAAGLGGLISIPNDSEHTVVSGCRVYGKPSVAGEGE